MLAVCARLLRRDTILMSALSLGPLMAGCVSAVDDSSSFGFNGKTEPAGTAAGIDPAASTAAGAPVPSAEAGGSQTAAAGGKSQTEAVEAEAAKQPPAEAATAEAATAAKGTEPRGGPIIASGQTTIAAYAGASVEALGETTASTPSSPEHADSTLFTSLFAQSKARTPLPNADKGKSHRVLLQRNGPPVEVDGSGAALPGVKSVASLFEIGQRASAAYDADILEEADGSADGSYQVASVTGLARLAPNGLTVQRPDVQTDCFEPQLVSMLHAVEARFHTKVLVTSGYRSPAHNRAVNGARRSMHMACKAADILVPGADKFAVATFVRSLPGRGGVGTYCHTTAVHIDIGRERDWNWACRRRLG